MFLWISRPIAHIVRCINLFNYLIIEYCVAVRRSTGAVVYSASYRRYAGLHVSSTGVFFSRLLGIDRYKIALLEA